MILYELLHGFLLEMRNIQYLWIAGSWATKMLQPASLGVTKKRPGAIPGVYNGALGSSWIRLAILSSFYPHHEKDVLAEVGGKVLVLVHR